MFRARSRKRSQLCITMEVEPRVAKQDKCHHCCSCKNVWGKGMKGGGKKCLCIDFWLTRRLQFCGKMHCGASYSTGNKLSLVTRHILTMGLENEFKVGSVKFANSLSLESFHCEESTHRK